MVMKKASLLCGVVIVFSLVAGSVKAQPTSGIVARMLFPPRNYEIALGDTITPTVRVWNTDTVAQAGMRIQYRITNVVNNITIYANPIVLPTIAPGDSIDTAFEPYISSSQNISELGTFKGCLIADDTFCGRLFGIRRTSTPFFDPSDNYSKTVNGDIPDQTMWVSVGATVVDGEDSTWDPPPPRYPGRGVGPDGMISPVIRLDRLDYNGNFYSGTGVGDTLTSFPINLAGKQREIYLTFDFMRGGRHRYPLGWDDSIMFGPESTIVDSSGNIIRSGDSLIIEFKKPSEPSTNPSPGGWNEMAAIDGGRDFEYQSLYASPMDSGWQINVNGTSKFLKDTNNYCTADFRFRVRLKANNDAPQSSAITDDADAWYIDNLRLGVPLLPSLQVGWVRVLNPYSKVPLSEANFPVFLSIHNLEVGGWGVPFRVDIVDPLGDTVYSQVLTLPYLGDSKDTILQFPNWDASGESVINGGPYTAIGSMENANYDDFYYGPTYSKFYLNTVASDTAIQEFAMDGAGMNPLPGVGNDIPKLTGVPGSGMGFDNATGRIAMNFYLGHYDSVAGVRLYLGSANPSPDLINIELWSGGLSYNSPMATLLARRDTSHLDQFSSYYFAQPIPLTGGLSYWMSVTQFMRSNMELGGSFARGGAAVVRAGDPSPQISQIYTSPYGTQWGSGAADNNGNAIGSFDLEIGDQNDNDNWVSFGSAMNLTDHLQPLFHIGDTSPWVGAGTYIPMIRPILGAVPAQSGVAIGSATPSLTLEPPYPNPFDIKENSEIITYSLPEQSMASLTICNVLGDVVRTLVNAPMTAGTHSLSWDGRDELGGFVPAGTYLLTLISAGHRATAKMIVAE
jgi:hypothetical protein